ncbi:pyridoxamine 5'-phosphate oxidase family protein [Aquipuribacter sp. SD81]|uniref:pyridoxamine 5'-phosphate oxidase family protein n=1 Tax=Aquipuribacter sp. SD81 TaxID=3127703 RepID=UPI00301631C7
MSTSPSAPPVHLAVHECWALLREAVTGRLAVVVDGAPDIFPVTHVVDHGSLVFRTADGTKLAAAGTGPVAYEVDGYDPGSGEAWSVVVKGEAHEVRQLHDALDVLRLPLTPAHPAGKPHLVRIEPTGVTGRRFRVRGQDPVGDPVP